MSKETFGALHKFYSNAHNETKTNKQSSENGIETLIAKSQFITDTFAIILRRWIKTVLTL